jgi:23S rRNA maturation-related 3'-5' exoribonuclease YhaM
MLKDKIEELLLSTGREGMEELIKHMDDNGFFKASCSGQYHLCKEGGLAEHSLNVHNILKNLNLSLSTNFEDIAGYESRVIVSILHDLGKMGQFGKPLYIENYLANGKVSEKKPYVTNQDLLSIPHEIRSIQIASQFIQLTEEESFAILHHNALYGDLKYAYLGHETPLSMLLHFSDLWCSRVVEKDFTEGEF